MEGINNNNINDDIQRVEEESMKEREGRGALSPREDKAVATWGSDPGWRKTRYHFSRYLMLECNLEKSSRLVPVDLGAIWQESPGL